MVEMFMGYGTIKDGKLVSLQSGHFPQVLVGLDASKPTPAVGDYYIATDTGKNYACYVNGVWNLVLSSTIEEYSNHLGTTDNMMSVAVIGNGAGTADATNHEMDLTTGAAGVVSYADYRANFTVNMQTTMFEFNCILKNQVSGTDGNRHTIAGLGNGGVGGYFSQTDIATWQVHTGNGITQEITDVTVVDGDILTVKGGKNIMQYFVNGVLVATHKTIVFAGDLCFPHVYIDCTAAATVARQISIDYIQWKVMK